MTFAIKTKTNKNSEKKETRLQKLHSNKILVETAQSIITKDCKLCRETNKAVENKEMSDLLIALGDCWPFQILLPANDFNQNSDGILQNYAFDKKQYSVMFDGKIDLLIFEPDIKKRKMSYLASGGQIVKKIETKPIIFIKYTPDGGGSFFSRRPAGEFGNFKEQNRIMMDITLSQFLYQYNEDFLSNVNKEIESILGNAHFELHKK